MGVLSLSGRLLFAAIFLASGAQKLTSFNLATGGPTMDLMAPRMDAALGVLEEHFDLKIPVTQAHYPMLLLVAIVLELVGGLLFVLGSNLGALMLLGFMLPVTAVMHTSWVGADPSAPEVVADQINFFKNVAMIGALLFFLGRKQ